MKKNKISKRLYKRLMAGDVGALSYAITTVENNVFAGSKIYNGVRTESGRAVVIGFTGPPGVGKSTLINAYIEFLRKTGKRVAVVAIDPSSPISGGAILGDRFRMNAHVHDSDVFIRSVSSRGSLGGLCSAIFSIIDLIDLAGWDVILLETVGAGQSDTDLVNIADIKVVIQAPGMGDGIQAIKAGILEIADVLVVNKTDLPLADRTFRQLQSMMELRNETTNQVPIIKTIAAQGNGLGSLHRAIEAQRSNWKTIDQEARYQHRMLQFFAREVGQMFEQTLRSMDHSELFWAYEQSMLGELDMHQVVGQMIEGLLENFKKKRADTLNITKKNQKPEKI